MLRCIDLYNVNIKPLKFTLFILKFKIGPKLIIFWWGREGFKFYDSLETDAESNTDPMSSFGGLTKRVSAWQYFMWSLLTYKQFPVLHPHIYLYDRNVEGEVLVFLL